MKNKFHLSILTVLICFSSHGSGVAQRINFGIHATEGITIYNFNPQGLDFNLAAGVLISGSSQSVQVGLMDDETVVLEIQAQADLDITVHIDIPVFLQLDASNMIPLSLNWAYSNMGSADPMTARSQAIAIQSGFQTFTFPVIRRAAGAPGPPPTPSYQGFSAPVAAAYLFIYGTLGPIGNIQAGQYEGIINITVSYTQI